MQLADTFIQGNVQYIAFKEHILSVNAFLGNRTHDLCVVSQKRNGYGFDSQRNINW